MDTNDMIAALKNYGFTVGPRDPRVNRLHAGKYMVIEPYEDDMLPTDDGANGPWAVVGNDLPLLVAAAYDMARVFYMGEA